MVESNFGIRISHDNDFKEWTAWAENELIEGDVVSIGSVFPKWISDDKQWVLKWEFNSPSEFRTSRVWIVRPGGDRKSYKVTPAWVHKGDTFSFSLALGMTW